MIIRNFGSDERCRITEKILSERLSGIREIDGIGRILLLPIPSSRDGVYITNSTLRLGEVLLATDSETLVAGYSIPETAAKMLGETGAAVYDGAMREKATAEWVEKFLDGQREILKKDCIEVEERRKTLAELDRRKLILKTKQDIIGEIIDGALKRLQGMPKKEYLSFIVALLSEYAENGEQILLSCDKVISKADLEKEQVVIDKNLSVLNERGDFIGGIQLIGKVSDRDLSFKAILEEKKETLTAKIVAELFN